MDPEAMRVVIQRVTEARVLVGGQVAGEIGPGLVVLVGVGKQDTDSIATAMALKIANLRIFNDDRGKMNISLQDKRGAVLAVSEFTLYAHAHGQRRPSFIGAAPAEQGKSGYDQFVRALRELGLRVETGVFQAHMQLELVNDGPVTILIDSDKTF